MLSMGLAAELLLLVRTATFPSSLLEVVRLVGRRELPVLGAGGAFSSVTAAVVVISRPALVDFVATGAAITTGVAAATGETAADEVVESTSTDRVMGEER